MYIRRKVFSKLQTEDGQERYFSTTEFTLMSEAEQREFSKKNDDEEEELSKEDKRAIKYWQKKRHKETAELKQAALEGDKEAEKKLTKKAYKKAMIASGAAGAIGGALIGASNSNKKGKGALIGAGIGAAYGTGIGALAGKAVKEGWKHRKKFESRNAQNKINSKLEHDQLAVANGKMSKKEFIKKWGN